MLESQLERSLASMVAPVSPSACFKQRQGMALAAAAGRSVQRGVPRPICVVRAGPRCQQCSQYFSVAGGSPSGCCNESCLSSGGVPAVNRCPCRKCLSHTCHTALFGCYQQLLLRAC